MTTLLVGPRSYRRDAPLARLMMADVMAASRSASALCWVLDAAISRPSEETAMASTTPGAFAANWLSSQLNSCASADRFCVVMVVTSRRYVDRVGWAGSHGRSRA